MGTELGTGKNGGPGRKRHQINRIVFVGAGCKPGALPAELQARPATRYILRANKGIVKKIWRAGSRLCGPADRPAAKPLKSMFGLCGDRLGRLCKGQPPRRQD